MNNSKSLAEAIRQANEERFRFAELVSQYWQQKLIKPENNDADR